MRWYYSSEDDSSKRGLVEHEVLFEMARKGELKPADLVWQEDSEEGWVPASSVEGLFTGGAQKAAEPSSAVPATRGAPPRPKKLKNVVVVLSVLAVLMTCAVVGTIILEIRRKNSIPPEPAVTEPPPEVVRSNRVAALSRQIDVFLRREDVARAEALWAQMKQNDDNGTPTATYSNRISALKAELAHFAGIQDALRKGELTSNLVGEAIKAYEKRGGNKELTTFAEGVFMDKDSLTPSVSLSLARLFAALDDHNRVKSSLGVFSALAPTNGPPDAHLEVVKMYCAENQPTNAMLLLQKYLAGELTNSAAWYELSAIRCANGHENGAMDALKQAVKFGNDDTRRAAVKDPRFTTIKDKWSFGRLTKVKE